MLLFLSYLVKAPTLPVRPTWLPSPVAIMTRAASSVFLAASPSSAQKSSSFRPAQHIKWSKEGKGSTLTTEVGGNEGSIHGVDTGVPGADVVGKVNPENPLSPVSEEPPPHTGASATPISTKEI